MGKRGFFAELQHQSQLAAKRSAQAARVAERQRLAAQRQAEQAQKRAQRAQAQAVRAAAAEQKAAEREARRLHDEAMTAEAEAKTAELEAIYSEIDSILEATLEVDDFVDLEALRRKTEHPPFPRPELEQPTAPPLLVTAPPQPEPYPEPVYEEPQAAKGIGSLFGGKRRHEEAVADARASYEAAYRSWQQDVEAQQRAWQDEVAAVPERQRQQMEAHQSAEQRRLADLEVVRARYEKECAQREAETAAANAELDALIDGLHSGRDQAVQEYVSIVLSNSIYPESFPVDHDFEFDASTRELVLTVLIPSPMDVPSEKGFRYVKAKDQIASTALTKKDQKERYAGAVDQVALRTLHEIFEADREECVQTISLVVGTECIDPGTGQSGLKRFAAVGIDRVSFLELNLEQVVPSAALEHLGAAISKNPFELVEISETPSVRKR